MSTLPLLLFVLFVEGSVGQTWSLAKLPDPLARCLDGSAGAYYVKPGTGSNASKFVLFQQAGGWAMSPADMLYRSRTSLGSTTNDPGTTTAWQVEDLLIANASLNPLFSTWTSVYFRYCDGASRASNALEPVIVNGTALFARGFPILRATMDALLSPGGGGGGIPSLASATDVILAGGSAGGLGVMLHADYLAERVAAVNPRATIAAVAAEGFFGDVTSIDNGMHISEEVFLRVMQMGNVTREGVNAACWDAVSANDTVQCFFPAHALPFVSTRVFIMNSFQDEYQAKTFLAPNISTLDAPGGLVETSVFVPCTAAPWSGCNKVQYAQWRGMGTALLESMLEALQAPTSSAHGAYLTSCPTHGSCIEGRCSSVTISGGGQNRTALSAMEALAIWLADSSSQQHIYIDMQWPAASSWPNVPSPNPTCPAPY